MDDAIGIVRAHNTPESIQASISSALDLIKFGRIDKVKSVIIKPNLCYYWDHTTGQTTDPCVVDGLIDWVREQYGVNTQIQLAEADATAMRTDHAFRMLGYKRLAQRKNVDLFNLSEDERIEKEVKVNQQTLSFSVPKSLLETDLFINVPKLKITTIKNVYVTCALKNLFGCIASPRKIAYHKFLNEAIVGISKVLHPHVTVVDGIFALGRYPVKLGLIMAGRNPFSIDWVGTQIMGYNPSKIEFLKIARKERMGNPDNIVVYGEKIQTFKKEFPIMNMRRSKLSMRILINMLKLYTKMTGDVIHPILEGI